MTRYVFRGLGARKLRTALTALAVVLGVAMISGTYVLTDTIDKAFSDVFQTPSQGVDVSVTGAKPAGFGSDQTSPPIDESLLPKVQAVDGVRVAEAGVFQQVSIRNKKGDSIGAGGAPNFISSNSNPPFNAFRYVEGAPPRTADQTALDQKIQAQQQAEQQKYQLAQAKVKAEQDVAQATGQANALKAQAEGEAQATLTRAKAQAEANKLLSQSLTPGLIRYQQLQRWDGKLSVFSGGGVTPLIDVTSIISGTAGQ